MVSAKKKLWDYVSYVPNGHKTKIYEYIKSFQEVSTYPATMYLNNSLAANSTEKAELFNSYF